MPKKRKGETRNSYVSRCVPIVKKEGRKQKAAVGKCEGMYDSSLSFDTVLCLDRSDSDTLATADPTIFLKEVVHVGDFCKGDHRFSITPQHLTHWRNTFAKMQQSGIDVPVPIEHTKDPERRRGKVLEFSERTNRKGLPALYAKIEFRDAESAKLSQSGVSIFVPREAQDGHGNKFDIPIQHVAITDYPVITDLEPFQPLVLSYGGDVNKYHNLAEANALCNSLIRDAESRGMNGLSLDFNSGNPNQGKPGQQAGDKPANNDKPLDYATPQQQQPANNPQGPQQMTLQTLAQQLGIDPNINDQQQLLLAIANAITQLKQHAQAPMPPRPQPGVPMPPQMMPQQQPMQRPGGFGPPGMHTGRPPIAMSNVKHKAKRPSTFELLLSSVSEEDVMAMSKKQFSKVIKAVKKGAKAAVSGNKDVVQKLNDKSNFGQEDIGGSDEDDTFKDEDNDAFVNGEGNETEEDTFSGKGKAGLSHGTNMRGLALSGSILDVVKNARQVKIDQLFSNRYINAAAKRDLEDRYIKSNSVSFSHEYDDGFDSTCAMILKNGHVLPHGRSGVQVTTEMLPSGVLALSNGQEANPLLADAQRRVDGKNNF